MTGEACGVLEGGPIRFAALVPGGLWFAAWGQRWECLPPCQVSSKSRKAAFPSIVLGLLGHCGLERDCTGCGAWRQRLQWWWPWRAVAWLVRVVMPSPAVHLKKDVLSE